MTGKAIAGRSYPHVYSVSGRGDLHRTVSEAIRASGGDVLFSSSPSHAPFYFGVQTDREERLGLLVYPFRVKRVETNGRPTDENRGQLRLGGEDKWLHENPVAFDPAGIDTTLMLGIDPEQGFFVGLDPRLWDPMPLGISFYAKDAQIEAMGHAGWHAWEKDNRVGVRRTARSESGLEAVVVFRPDRFLDFARFERRATDLGLDTALRLATAERFTEPRLAAEAATPTHMLEQQFGLTSSQILEIIATRSRLLVATRGGVAEYQLEQQLRSAPYVSNVRRRDADGAHDFDVDLSHAPDIRIECKNCSPNLYANGDYKVEVQKTRASKGDPASRFYRVSDFDVVAACLFSPTGSWEFRFAWSEDLARHSEFPDRLAPLHHVDDSWATNLAELPARTR